MVDIKRLVPQVVWFGDSHFQDATYLKDGYSLLADIQTRMYGFGDLREPIADESM